MPSTNGHGPKRAILYARVSSRRTSPLRLLPGPATRGPESLHSPRGLRGPRGGSRPRTERRKP
jgi:hypothetical protein